MRYVPNTQGGGSNTFSAGNRPDLSKIPKALADLILERDRIMTQRHAARDRVNHLASAELQHAAEQADDDTATKAARAGKDIPAATAVAKLEAERVVAARALEAQEAAFATVTDDCDQFAAKLYWDGAEARAAKRAKIIEDITAKAYALADEVEAAVDSFAVSDWMRGLRYDRTAQTWPTDVTDLSRYGLDHFNTSVISVRDVLVAASTTALQEN